ncbi:MAG: CoA ester lyase [Geminicoccaceae bacterium]|nr:CoA ester lyase [Geminicoccaceae bacterium]
MRLRSLLYVPAHVDRFVARAHERGADAVILDLEDSVPEAEKDAARASLATAAPHVAQSGVTVFVRVNATDRLEADVRAAMAAGTDGVMLPKAVRADSIDRLPDGDFAVIAVVESADGLLAAREVAAHPRVIALCLGGEDFATDTGAVPDPDVLRLPKLLLHYAAKAEGKISLGLLRSVAQFDDPADLAAAAAEASKFGFDGATCIHPKVVDVLNTAFTPSAEQIAHARRIVAAAETAAAEGRGALMLDGEFIDAPVVARHRAILARGNAATGTPKSTSL